MSQIVRCSNNFSEFNDFVRKEKPSKILFLVDENTHEYCLPILLGNFETDIPFEIIEIESGESSKTLEITTQLYEIILEFEADRNALIVNLGGGVITDLGGFVASTYKRGINFINIPTTVLSMCDAAIGGKTGVNLGSLKNIVGTFSDAKKVFVYPEFLRTLPHQQILSGFAEMLKHGLIADAKHFEELVSLPTITCESIATYLANSAIIKEKIVEMDPHEKNLRKNLNYGHTVGHALESLAIQKERGLPHGFAIAAGMVIENIISFKLDLLTKDLLVKINTDILKFFPKQNLYNENDFGYIIELMKNDKKNSNSKFRMSLITEIGLCKHDVEADEKTILLSLSEFADKNC